MPDPLEALLRSVGEVLSKLTGNIIEWLTSFFENTWKAHLLMWGILWGIIEQVISWQEKAWDYISKIELSYGSTAFPQVTEHIQFVNSILPLSELLVFLVGYLTLVVVLTCYSLFKSWVPAV
jgi:hypothetical protein